MKLSLTAFPSPMTREQRENCRGFTLIELLTVLAILGIVFGLATLSTGLLTSTSLTASTRNFADFVNLCRSQAIAQHTAVRVGVVVQSPGNPDAEFRQYSSWSWNQRSRQFEQMTRWNSLPNDVVFEQNFPNYLRKSAHAERDASSVRGDFVLGGSENIFEANDAEENPVQLAFFQFTPSGRIQSPGADLRNLILVLNSGRQQEGEPANNWAQINLDTLTGRYRIYRPE